MSSATYRSDRRRPSNDELSDVEPEDRDLIDQAIKPNDGDRPPEPDNEDRGFMRDDGFDRPKGSPDAHLDDERGDAVTPDDARAPEMVDIENVTDHDEPEELDHKSKAPAADDELADAYSTNAPGVETKD